MNISGFSALLNNQSPALDLHLNALPTRQRRTVKAYLEASVRLAYVLWATGQEGSATCIVNAVSSIPLTKNQDYWTWIEAALILKGTLAQQQGNHGEYAATLALTKAGFNTGDALADEINAEVHNEFLEGRMLNADFATASDTVGAFDMRLSHLMDLLKIGFFGGSAEWPLPKVNNHVTNTVGKLNQSVARLGFYNLPPYK